MVRRILAVIIGLLVGGLGIMLVQSVSMHMYPMPEGLDYKDTEAFGAYVKTLPIGAFLVVIFSYIFGSFFGGMSATSIAKEKYRSAIIVGSVLTLAGIMNAMRVPQPMWVSIVPLLMFVPFAYLGAKVFPLKN